MSEAGDIDVLAAEYVLGTLDAQERAQAQAMLAVDQALAAKVRIWERRLSELHLMVEPVAPDDEIWERIKAKMVFVAPKAAASADTAVPATAATAVAATTPAAASISSAATSATAPVVTGTPPSWLSREPSPPPPSLPPAPNLVPLKPSEESEPQASEQAESLAGTLDAAKAVEAALSEAVPAESVTERAAETAEKPQSAERSADTVERTPAETPVAEERSAAAADGDGTPSGVFDDMPEPTPTGVVVPPSSGPLAGLPPSFTAASKEPSLAPAPPATLSVPIPPKAAPVGPALTVRPERRPQAPVAPKRWLSRFIATVMTLILLGIAALVAAWRFVPDRLPQPLQPVEVLRAMGIATPVTIVGPPPRRPAPPESRYEE